MPLQRHPRLQQSRPDPNEDGSDLQIDLHGDLAGIISIARKGEEPLETSDFETMVLKLVAEEGLEPPTRGL